jgi:hypothetical protein
MNFSAGLLGLPHSCDDCTCAVAECGRFLNLITSWLAELTVLMNSTREPSRQANWRRFPSAVTAKYLPHSKVLLYYFSRASRSGCIPLAASFCFELSLDLAELCLCGVLVDRLVFISLLRSISSRSGTWVSPSSDDCESIV